MKLNWVTLRVNDLEKSLSFYTKLLNLEIAAKFGSPEHPIVMLGKAEEPKIELIQGTHPQIDSSGNGVSFGLEADDLDRVIAVLRENGYQAEGPLSPNPKIRFFFVRDPDGYSVQLVEQK